jgi:hypothetical protein
MQRFRCQPQTRNSDIKQKRLTLAGEARTRLYVPQRCHYFVSVHQQRYSAQTVRLVPVPGSVRYRRDLVKRHLKDSYDSGESCSHDLHSHYPHLQKKKCLGQRLHKIAQGKDEYELEAVRSLVTSVSFSVSGASSPCRRRVPACSLVSSARGRSRTGSFSSFCPFNILSLLSASCLVSLFGRSSTGASFVVVPSIL